MKYYVSCKVNGTGSLRGLYVEAPKPARDYLTDAVIDALHLNPKNVEFIQFYEVKPWGASKIDISEW